MLRIIDFLSNKDFFDRKEMGIIPGNNVYIEATPNQMILRKILSIDEIFELPYIAHGTPEEFEEDIDKGALIQEELTVKKIKHVQIE